MKINELSEKEILALTAEDIEFMIKLRKAEEGIRFVPRPKEPEYNEIPEPDETVFMCELFGTTLCFKSLAQLTALIDLIYKSDSKCLIDYDYNRGGSEYFYLLSEMKKSYNADWNSTNSKRVYSLKLYNYIVDKIAHNKKIREEYNKENEVYENFLSNSKEIETEIKGKYREVVNKYNNLTSLCLKMKNDYLPLAAGNEEIAFNFLIKAYPMNAEEQGYVLENYMIAE